MRPTWLDAAVLTGTVVTGAAAAVSGPAAPGLLLAALAALPLAWFTVGRRTEDGAGPWLGMVAVLVAVGLAGSLATPAFATVQIVALPLAWMTAPDFVRGLLANAAIALAVGVGYAAGASPAEAVAVEGVSFGFSVAMSAWITRIEHTSAARQALVERLTAAQDRIAILSREAGTVGERERLARELHDTLAQSLAGIVMLAERSRTRHPGDVSLGVLEDAARQALTEARGLVTAGANVPLEGGLAAALQTLAERFRRETGLAVSVEAQADVPRGLEVVLLRCAQEGLANVRKHAAARRVMIALTARGEEAVLRIEDDGAGPGAGTGFGIEGMRDRLALVDGAVDLRPGTEGGSVLSVRVPVRDRVAP